MSERLIRSGFLKSLVFTLSFFMAFILMGHGYVNADDADLNPDEIDLYYIDDSYVSILGSTPPSKYLSSYKINVTGLTGTPSYKVVSNTRSTSVSSDGVITPTVTKWYKQGNYWTTAYVEGAEVTYEHSTGTSVVRVTCGDYTEDITVNVKNYANAYADDKIDEVLGKIITSGMTDQQKLTAMTKWVAENTDYSASYSGYVSMMVHGSGDCWASTNTIVEMCTRCGIKAKGRPANHDSGAGSGHRNAIALCDGKYYIGEAGFSGSKPRPYQVYEVYNGFSNRGSTIYQYDGFDKDVVVPEKIGNTTVTKFGSGTYTVFNSSEIVSVRLSKTITEIGGFAFVGTPDIKVTVDPDSEYLTVDDGALYSKDKKSLFFVPKNITSLTIDKNTNAIAPAAFYKSNISKIVIPGNVKTIGQQAFIYSSLKQVEIENGITSIDFGTFAHCYDLTTLSIPLSVTEIGKDAFTYSSKLNIYYEGTEEDWNKINFASELPSAVKVHFKPVRVTGIEQSDNSNITMTKKGQTIDLGAKVIPSNATNQEVIYTTEDKNIVKVEGNTITAVGEGNCKITATTKDGNYTAVYNVTVAFTRYKLTIDGGCYCTYETQDGHTVTIDHTEGEFIEGEVVKVYIRKPSNTVVFKQWELDGDDLTVAGELSSTSLSVTMPSRDVKLKAVYTPVLVTSISLKDISEVYYTYICPDMTKQLGATVYPANAYDKSVTWSSTNESIATVDSNGKVTGVAAGNCQIIATAADGSGITGTYRIYVYSHLFDKGTVTKEATCEEDGIKLFACTRKGCTHTKTETIPALGHNPEAVAEKAPSKTESGYIAHYKCSRCGKLFSDAEGKNEITASSVVIPATGHDLTKIGAKSQTCTEDGNIEYYVCKDTDCGCGKFYSDPYGQHEINKDSVIIAAAGHKLSNIAGKPATCEADGYEAYYKCSVCNKMFSDKSGQNQIEKPVVISKTGHEWDSGSVTKKADCENAGTKTFKCIHDGCTKSKTETIPALGHDPEKVAAKEATYDDVGWIEHYVCKRCGKKFSDSACKNPVTDDDILIPCKKHTLTKIPAKAPSCTETGYKEHYKCKDDSCGCGKLFSDKFGLNEISVSSITIPAAGHKLTKIDEKKPTCTETGNNEYWKCNACGKLFSDAQGKNEIDKASTVKAALGHDCDHLDHHGYKAPTRDNDGSKEYYICPRCGKKFADSGCKTPISDAEIVIPAIGAAKLGEETDVNDFRYKVTYAATDGTGTVTLIGTVNPVESAVIPAVVEIKESIYKVNRIGPKAFYNNKTLRTLNIGANVVTIDGYAFYGCSNLVKVSGGYRLKTVGSYAFARCSRLSSFKITSRVLSKVGSYAFYKDSRLKTVYIKYTTKLTKKGVKKSLKGSKVKKVKVKKSKVRKYKKYFTKKNCGRRVKVKK